VSFFSTPSLTPEDGRRVYALLDKAKEQTRVESAITIAGATHICFESQTIEIPNWVEIACLPEKKSEGMDVSFMGHKNLKPMFLETLQRITRD
ncbi:MAG: hypothetical protein AB7O65_04430, partial [Candidatus Korobacteraceae bacterium]